MSGYSQSKATLDGWHKAVCDILEPLYDLQKASVLQSTLLAGDGSPMPVVDNEKHHTVKSCIVELRSIDTGIPIFLTAPDGTQKGNGRGKAVIQGYLSEWKGYGFMYDACASYGWLGKNPEHWLTYTLKHMNTWPKDRLEELPPENWTDDTI